MKKSSHSILDLFQAIDDKNVKEMKRLIAAGIDINQPGPSLGNTPLHFATSEGNLDAVRCLLENKAKIDPTNQLGRTPLHHAVTSIEPNDFNGIERIIFRMLLKAGANPNIEDKTNDKYKPIDLANSPVIRKILQEDIDELPEAKKTNLSTAKDSSWNSTLQTGTPPHDPKEQQKLGDNMTI